MKKIRYGLIALIMLCMVTSAAAQVSIGIGLPNVSIGINLPLYPQLVLVPGYPVYYAPQMNANYFFYDGMYWVYESDTWYASSWYNGPWGVVEPYAVPLYILRIPVSYYRQPPMYFRGWQSNAPPRWGQHWGHDWEQRRTGWDRWNRGSAPAPAPLPVYQRQYSGDRYPRLEQQQPLRSKNYRYQPRDTVVRQHIKQQVEQQRAPAPAQRGRQEEPQMKGPKQQPVQQPKPPQQGAPADRRSQPPQQGGENARKAPPVQTPAQQRPPAAQEQRKQQPAPAQHEQRPPAVQEQRKQQPAPAQHEQQAPRVKEQEQRSQQPNQGRGQGQNKDEERGRGRD